MFEVKEKLTKENILQRIDEYSIFKAYCPNFKEIDKKFIAELNRTNKEGIPSAVITYYRGRLWYKDFGSSDRALDCFGYIQAKYGMSYIQALGTVNLDFNIGLEPVTLYRPSLNYVGLPDHQHLNCNTRGEYTLIMPNVRKWLKRDKEFWYDRYKIEKTTLDLYDVKPINWYLLNNKFFQSDKHTYAYHVETEDSIEYYKIYQPYAKDFKWISNCKAHHYQGYNQLPISGDLLVITKSLKDVMLLYQFGYSSISPGSEAHQIDDGFMRLLRRRFERIIIFFDNDAAGIKGAHKITYHHGIESIIIPNEYGVKDISDFVEKYSFEEGKKLINKLIYR